MQQEGRVQVEKGQSGQVRCQTSADTFGVVLRPVKINFAYDWHKQAKAITSLVSSGLSSFLSGSEIALSKERVAKQAPPILPPYRAPFGVLTNGNLRCPPWFKGTFRSVYPTGPVMLLH